MSLGWEEKWIIIDSNGESGGQGAVYRVKRKEDSIIGALKIMHEGNSVNSERRKRMAREVYALESLQKLNRVNVPSVLEHNMEKIKDKQENLYMISEWIDGITLATYVQSNDISVTNALKIIMQLLDILKECHQSGIIHRDIKPDNIIINQETLQIYLIDFGIAYMELKEGDIKTQMSQELGNRFFRIPDYAPGSTKRDYRSDITLTVGVLFYLITKKMPRILIDENGNPPHVAHKESIKCLQIEEKIKAYLNNIFEIGFKVDKNLRFQQSEELEEKIMNILEPQNMEDVNENSLLEEYNTLITSVKYKEKEMLEMNILEIAKKLENQLETLAAKNGLYSIHLAGRARLTEERDCAFFSYNLVRGRDMTSPGARLCHKIQICRENSSYIETKYNFEGMQEVTYYRGLLSDIERLENEVIGYVVPLFNYSLKELMLKLKG